MIFLQPPIWKLDKITTVRGANYKPQIGMKVYGLPNSNGQVRKRGSKKLCEIGRLIDSKNNLVAITIPLQVEVQQ